MTPADIDPSLRSADRPREQLDDGFSPPPEIPPPPEDDPPQAPGTRPALPAKSLF